MLGHTVIIEVSTQARDEAVGLALSAEVVVYPTGLWAPVAPDWLTKKATDHPYIRTVADGGGYVFVDREAWDALGLERPAEAV